MSQTPLFQKMMPYAFLLGILLAAAPLQAASNVKLSGVMPAFGGITNFRISPNGRYAVYRADQDTDGVIELYSVLLGGGDPVRLNPLLPTGRNVTSFVISPDSSRVLYRANQDNPGVFELFSVPIGGPATAGVKLNVPLAPGGSVFGDISPDSRWVVYYADHQVTGVFELFCVPLRGPTTDVIKLNGTLPPGGLVASFVISPDSSRVLYQADQDNLGVFELYIVPIRGPAEGVKLNGPLIAGGRIYEQRISPDSSRVVYTADQDTLSIRETYSVSIGGPSTAGFKLNGILANGGNVESSQISPDSSRVVYVADQQIRGVYELYSVPLGGPATAGIKLNGNLTTGGDGGDVTIVQISPDSGRVLYIADQDTNAVLELYMTSNYYRYLPLMLR